MQLVETLRGCHKILDNSILITSHQQSKKFAAIRSSRAISGGMGNSGISVELLVNLTLYVKYMQTFCST